MSAVPLAGKVAIVTAAAGDGIGYATARRLASDGAIVVVTDQHARRTAEVEARLADEFGADRVFAYELDVADRDQIDAMVESVESTLGRVDIVINNAGMNVPKIVHEIEPAEWDRVIDVCLSGPWYICRRTLPLMLSGDGGSIINISSPASSVKVEREGAYAAAKAGLQALTRAIATEYGPTIRCNAVAPGYVEGYFVNNVVDEARKATRKAETPLDRFARPDEVAALAAFLASDESAFITGETVWITGGLVMRA